MQPQSLANVELVLRDRICGVCTDRAADGNCGLEEPSDCALFRLLPQVAAAVIATNSDDIQDYIRAIRNRVCSECREEASDGSCLQRQEVRCALDAYLLPVVDAIEEVTQKAFDRSRLVTGGMLTSGLLTTIEGTN
jgi:hypothetical protein